MSNKRISMEEQTVVADAFMFFNKTPQALPLYETLINRLSSEFKDFSIKVQKTQITFCSKRNFLFVWLPIHKIKNRPEVYIVVSFGFDHRVIDPRIENATEPYPNRWTHHVIIQNATEINDQLMSWIKEAYAFSLRK